MHETSAQKRKLRIQWKEWKWNQVPWISVCAPTTVHVRVREGGMGGKVEVEKKKKANLHLWNETAHLDVDDKQYEQQQQQQSIKEDSEWHQAVGMNDWVQFKVKETHHKSGRKILKLH